MKRCKSVQRTIFFLIEFFCQIYIWNWHIIGILLLKANHFSQFITKMGFCCEIFSLNDITLSPVSRPGTHCFQWQRANARANLWWWHKPFPCEISIALRPCAGKVGVAKSSWWCLGIIPSNRCFQFTMISQIWEEIHLYYIMIGEVSWGYCTVYRAFVRFHGKNARLGNFGCYLPCVTPPMILYELISKYRQQMNYEWFIKKKFNTFNS